MDLNSLTYFIMTTLQNDPYKNIEYGNFTIEDLHSIEQLNINSLTKIHNISGLINLKQLNIVSMNPKEYEVATIIDYGELNDLINLETLTIINNHHIEQLDLSGLKNLKRLILVSNSNLNTIRGLDQLKNLEQVVIVGNCISNIEWLKEYLNNTKNININILDYKLFNRIVENQDVYELLTNLEMSYETNLSFAEKIGVGEIFIYSYHMLRRVYNIAKKIIDDNITDDMTEEQKVETLYKYVVSHLKYDNENLEKRASYIFSNNSINIYNNKYKYINSSYQAIISGKAICEGYANMLIFLLNMIGIQSKIVYSTLKQNSESNQKYYDHAANKIKIDNEWFYFDAQLETDINNLKFYKKSRQEFIETHDILYIAEIDKCNTQKIK